MTAEYANQAVADLHSIAAYYEGLGSPGVGRHIAARIDEVAARITLRRPKTGRRAAGDQNLRVVPLGRYPYLVYYEVIDGDGVRILHIRHTSRRPWSPVRR